MSQALPFRPQDGYYRVDDFDGNDTTPADVAGTRLLWEVATIGNASTLARLATTDCGPGEYGVLRMTTAATADGDGAALRLEADTVVLDGSPGSLSFKVRYPVELASSNFVIGLADSVTATPPTVGISVQSDAGVISLRCDSADGDDILVAASGVSTLTSGTTCVVGTWHNFEIRWSGTNANGGPANVDLYVDNELAAVARNWNLDDDEEMELSIKHWQDSGGADAVIFDIDFIDVLITRS